MIIGYPTPDKAKAKLILDAFCEGAGGKVTNDVSKLHEGDAAFYGVVPDTANVYQAAIYKGRDVYYLDNAYFDSVRQVYFRATKNQLQHDGLGASNGKRFRELNIEIKEWRTKGDHIVICPQSDQFMKTVVGYQGNWLKDTVEGLKQLTDRPLRIRPWNGNKKEWYSTLPADLINAHALVTFSSASAITAILSGVPAICTAKDSIAHHMSGRLHDIEKPPMPINREAWAGVIADNQWTLSEFRNGTAWKMLNE
jgi:hypothetical protein